MKINVFNEVAVSLDKKLVEKIEEVMERYVRCDFFSQKKNRIPDILTSKQNTCLNINLILKSKKGIRQLNTQLFEHNCLTDVIAVDSPSISCEVGLSNDSLHIGDVYVCPAVVQDNADDGNYRKELARVTIHGILHVLGFDHKKSFGESKEEIFKIQEELLAAVV